MKIKKELKLGIFLIVVLAATFVVLNYLRGADLLGKRMDLVGHFDDVETLVASAPVQVRGFIAGKVDAVEYCAETDDFVVTVSVEKQFKIPTDSRLVLYSTSIMGGKGIKVELGNATEYATNGTVLKTGSEVDLLSSLAPVLSKVTSMIDSLSVTVSHVNSVLDEQNRASLKASLAHLNATLASAEKLAKELGGKSDEVNEIVDNLKDLSVKLSPIAESAQNTLSNVESVTKKLDESDIKGTVENLNRSMDNINRTVDDIKGPLDSLITDADNLLKKVVDNPKKYLKITVF